MRVALLQINPTAGDIAGNAALIVRGARQVQDQGADLIVTPELALMGYLPRDLLMNQGFVRRSCQALHDIASELASAPPLLVGVATPNPSDMGRPLFNSAVLLQNGEVGPAFHKTLLPTYDVFDEDRYFEPAAGPQILELNGWRLGISICEDVWNDRDFWQRRRYHQDPIEMLVESGAQAIVNLSSSPIHRRQTDSAGAHARPHGPEIRAAGGVREPGGRQRRSDFRRPKLRLRCAKASMLARAKGFQEDICIVDLAMEAARPASAEDDFETEAEIWHALVLGVRDYVSKTRFSKVLLGLSGGVDSALTAAIAAEAVGPENVLGVLMPSLLFERRQRGRFGRAGAQPRHPNPDVADQPTSCRLTTACWPKHFATASPTSPKKTSSRAFAAIC